MAVIREADREDVGEIARLACSGARLVAGARGSERCGSMVRSMVDTPGQIVLVAEAGGDGALAGFIAGTEMENGPFVVSRYGYVRCVRWEEDLEEPGLGIALYEALYKRLAGVGLGAAQTDVQPQDSAGRRFWEARGFRVFLDRLWRPTGAGGLASSVSLVKIREARAGDSEVVLGLWAEMMELHSALDERLRVVSSWRSQVGDMLIGWRRDPGWRVLVADGTAGVIGFAVGSIEDPVLGVERRRYGHIAHLCVGADYGGQGVGHQLFDSLRAWFQRRGVASIHLLASSLNPRAQRFWRRLGFRDYEKRLWCTLT